MTQPTSPSEFLVLSRGHWDPDKSADEIQQAIDAFYVWHDQLVAQGRIRPGQRLDRPARLVSRSGVVDGPFTEAKEVVGGYWFFVAASLQEATALAAQNPCLACGLQYEVRPIALARATAEALSSETPPAPVARQATVLAPGEGRIYPMGRMRAVFKADAAESASRYAISEWWLEPHTQGPGAHAHPEDDVFYVIEGTMSLRVGEAWTHASRGAFVLVPGGVTHDFENRGDVRAGVLNLSIPGPFEPLMPGIVQWFAEHPPQSTDT